MPSVRVFSGAVIGLDAFVVEVEVDSTPGLHFFNIVGLADKAVQESKDRVAAAIKNSGFIAPKQKNRRVIVNLAPADIKKEGPAYDLPIALGYLLTTKQIQFLTNDKLFLGELSLNGSLRRVNGVLPAAFMARSRGLKEIIVPKDNANEAAVVRGLKIIGVKNLKELCGYLESKMDIIPVEPVDYETVKQAESYGTCEMLDMTDIKGQNVAKRALLIAACGGHNLLMYGPPGSGKTLLAQAMAGILPKMSYEEALEVTKIYSISGLVNGQSIISDRPFRSPHHTTSAVAVIGGGTWPKPGEISLAHRGVLFLDEFPEFARNVIEALRQPMENGEITVSRAAGTVKFPARFMLVAAMNPCPCGNYGDEIKACICTPQSVFKYQRKISGPLLDRIDIQISVPRVTYERISSQKIEGQTSSELRLVVQNIRRVQQERFEGAKIQTNSEMGPKEIRKFCPLTDGAEKVLKKFVVENAISGRSYHKILKIARTLADIDGQKVINEGNILEAKGYKIKTEGESFFGLV